MDRFQFELHSLIRLMRRSLAACTWRLDKPNRQNRRISPPERGAFKSVPAGREQKLRRLAPVLRRALEDADRRRHRRQLQLQREQRLGPASRAIEQAAALADLLALCHRVSASVPADRSTVIPPRQRPLPSSAG